MLTFELCQIFNKFAQIPKVGGCEKRVKNVLSMQKSLRATSLKALFYAGLANFLEIFQILGMTGTLNANQYH